MGLYFSVDTNECANLQGGVSDYNCTCVTGWEGQNCDINTDDCTPDPCENGATCNDQLNGFTCSCVEGFEGTMCETNHNDCSPYPCGNGGTCIDLVNGYQCDCIPGWTGDRCSMAINECSPDPCQNNATCYVSISTNCSIPCCIAVLVRP